MFDIPFTTGYERKGQAMKYTLKRILAIMIAIMIAMPGAVFADELAVTDVVIGEDGTVMDGDLTIEDDLVGQGGLYNLSDQSADGRTGLGDLLDLDPQLLNNAPQEPASEPFEQSAALGNVGFTVTAGAGVFQVGAALRVVEVEADVAQAAIQSVEAAVGCEATHCLYSIQVLDAEENPLSPNAGMELPLVRVKGLNLADGVRVFVYDRNLDGSYEIEANGAFRFQESGIYDIVCPARDSEETQKQPVEQPVEQPADQQE